MQFKRPVLQVMKKLVWKEVEKSANTACPMLSYQPKEPKQIKQLRKF